MISARNKYKRDYFPMQRVISHKVRLSLIGYLSTSQKKCLQISCIILFFKGNIIWTYSVGIVMSLSEAFISFAKRVVIDFGQVFSQLLRILFYLNL